MNKLLEIEHLRVTFKTPKGEITPVDGINLDIIPGETVCIVGESGSGKSVTSLSIPGLLGGNGRIAEGHIRLDNVELTSLSEAQLRKVRGKQVSMVFQEPMTALNPVIPIGNQLIEVVRVHSRTSRKEAASAALQMLRNVGIARPEAVMKEYPHSLSGGMRQRIVIAMALICKPRLLIADEPTTALDVTIQAQILHLMKQLRHHHDTAILLITHDLSIVAEMADRVAVMYAGQIVEQADVNSLFDQPVHPYTQGLMKSVPSLNAGTERLVPIPGTVPSLADLPAGCRFQERCPYAAAPCRQEQPQLDQVGAGHLVRCWLPHHQSQSQAAGG
ncbi:ABC transporter ATP-binding protein [Paenibacillus silvae]|uniref:ABC transporter ATP-binding protein n=1 Tax=Paenibacillus silvae TaxID=1325358 RepID=UPI0025A1FA83|nr:ABC transporter ATP-binding protein [Paenibacillus silvae]MDM5281077.1 ABC transporter ATP-binding protein [Paenibacillus silvae]